MTAPLRAHKRPGRAPCAMCDQPLYARGLCVMHYSRLRRTGDAGSASRIRGARGAGHINEYGYRVLCAPDHPLAGVQGKVLEHRAVLFDAIGPGPHPCHWCERLLPWSGGAGVGINVDHLDEVRLNNELSNLVVSCLDCNTKRSRSAA